MESFAPVVKVSTVRIMLTIACIRNLKIRQYDVKSAYLNGTLKERVLMEQPPEFHNGKDEVCLLKKSIYGLPRSGHYWNNRLNEIMECTGLERMKEDPCVYVYNKGGEFVMIGVYVDDFLVIGSGDDTIDRIINRIRADLKITEIEDKCFLNIEIIKTQDGLELSQENYNI